MNPILETTKVYGYYDRPDQPMEQPTINPDVRGPCLFCGEPMTAENIRTHSMMAMPETGPERSYFYRTHRTCHEAADNKQRVQIDDVVWDSIRHHGD